MAVPLTHALGSCRPGSVVSHLPDALWYQGEMGMSGLRALKASTRFSSGVRQGSFGVVIALAQSPYNDSSALVAPVIGSARSIISGSSKNMLPEGGNNTSHLCDLLSSGFLMITPGCARQYSFSSRSSSCAYPSHGPMSAVFPLLGLSTGDLT